MALTKSLTFKKATYAGAYAKITELSSYETGTNANGKNYALVAQVNIYADSAKDTDLEQETVTIADQKLEDLTYTNAYAKLKLDKYSDWSDC